MRFIAAWAWPELVRLGRLPLLEVLADLLAVVDIRGSFLHFRHQNSPHFDMFVG
jgi:hypothetical protein